MTTQTNIIQRLFLFYAMIFTGVRLLENWFSETHSSFWQVFWLSMIMSAVASVLHMSIHLCSVWLAVRSSKYGNKKIDFEATGQTLEINVPKPPMWVFEELRDTLQPRKWQLLEFDKTAGYLKCETPVSFWHNGENVEIWVRSSAEGQSNIKAVSKSNAFLNIPFFNFSALDFGKNKRNINLIEHVVVA